jgi:hypothetical protein
MNVRTGGLSRHAPSAQTHTGSCGIALQTSAHIFFRMWGRIGKWWCILLHKLEISSRASAALHLMK